MRAVLAMLAPKRALCVAPGGCAPLFPCVARHGRIVRPGQESRRFGRTGKLASRRSRMDDTIALRIERDRRPVAGLAAPALWVELACPLVKFVPAGQQTAIPAGMAL